MHDVLLCLVLLYTFLPTSVFIRVDFPALGAPTNIAFNSFSSWVGINRLKKRLIIGLLVINIFYHVYPRATLNHTLPYFLQSKNLKVQKFTEQNEKKMCKKLKKKRSFKGTTNNCKMDKYKYINSHINAQNVMYNIVKVEAISVSDIFWLIQIFFLKFINNHDSSIL